MNWALLQNSLWVAGMTAVLGTGLGSLAALAILGLPTLWRRRILVACVVAFMMPPFLIVNCWLDLAGVEGQFRTWVPFDLYSTTGVVLMLASMYWPVACLLIGSVWCRLDGSLFEHDAALTGGSLLRWLLWPAARRAAGLSAVVIGVLALNHFSIPALLQVAVLPAEIWIQFNTTFDYEAALLEGWPMILGPALMLGLVSRLPIVESHSDRGTISPLLARRQLGGAWTHGARAVLLILLAVSTALPIAHLLSNETGWRELGPVLKTAAQPAWNSVRWAGGAALLSLALSVALWNQRGAGLAWLTFFAPGILLGIGLIHGLNRPALLWLYPSSAVVWLAWVIRYLAPCWQCVRHAFQSTDPSLADAARLQGASKWTLITRIQGPQIATQTALAGYLTYLFCLWDVETLTLIVPPGGETIALRVFNLLHYGHLTQVNALCLLLLALALAPIALWQASRFLLRRRSRLHWTLWTGPLAAGICCGCDPAAAPANSSLPGRMFDRVEILGNRGTALGQFNKPRSLTVDLSNHLYVADLTGRIQRFSPDGHYQLSWYVEETDRGKPKGMGCDREGHILVIEPHYARMNHYDTSGRRVTQWGQHGTADGFLTLPRAVAVAANGNLYISQYTHQDRIQIFSHSNHAFLRAFGQTGSKPGELNRPEGLAFNPEGDLHVADSCNHRIQVFRADGTWHAEYGRPGSGPGELSYPCDIQIDEEGRQYVCEFGNSRIQVFDRQYRSLEIIGGPGSGPGQFSNPWGIALDRQGNLYVADSGNHRVQKLVRRRPR